jgi:dTDP-4-amino-4,6-dideoxygalactose transaminase
MRIPFQDLGRLHASLGAELDDAISAAIAASAFISGPPVVAFEEAFAAAIRIPHVAGCSSGTDALSLALRALGVGPGDEVVVPSMTYIATAEAVLHVGATPVIADVHAETVLLDEASVAEVRSDRTRAVIPVHLFGHVVDHGAIRRWREEGLIVLEDCAQAHLATWQGEPIGSVGHAAAFSFYPGKNLGAMGDAGAVASQQAEVVAEVQRLRDHGRRSKYVHDVLGYGARLDALQAAILSVKLRHLHGWTVRRRELADRYRAQLQGVDQVTLVPWEDGAVHHLLVVRSPRRDELQQHLEGLGVQTGIHYPMALSDQPALADFHRVTPEAERAADEVLSLPMDPLMTDDEVDRVCAAIAGFR